MTAKKTPSHDTMADTLPDLPRQGGTWYVECLCGWRREGRYARTSGEAVALRLAGAHGTEHERDPGEAGG